jgi:hypothetical protein
LKLFNKQKENHHMKKRISIFVFVLIGLFAVTGCTVDPRRAAAAYETMLVADQYAADKTQARDQAQDLHELDVQHKQAIAAEWEAGMNKVIRTCAIVAQYSFALVIIAASAGLSWAAVGTGKAWARFVDVRANLIRLDPITRQFPQLIQYVGKGRFTISNLNVDSTRLLDTRQDADRQMILGMSNTQYAGALAHESRLSLRPGEVAGILPAFVEVCRE